MLSAGSDGHVFWQRFYSTVLVNDRIATVTGRPTRMVVWGERDPGFILRDTLQKWSSSAYPFWAEPVRFLNSYKRFASIDALPGEGVVGLEFVKGE